MEPHSPGTKPGAPTARFDFSKLPRNVDRKTAAELVTLHFFQAAPRSLEVWPLRWVFVNGRAHCETRALFACAQEMLDAAPPLHSVRRRLPASFAA